MQDSFGIAPIATAEKNQAGTVGLGKSEKARKIKIGCYDDPLFAVCQVQQFRVLGTVKPDLASMNRIVPFPIKPMRKSRRKRHIDQKLEGLAGQRASSIVSSSAKKAA